LKEKNNERSKRKEKKKTNCEDISGLKSWNGERTQFVEAANVFDPQFYHRIKE
jgi:hypothetical protein